MRIGKRLAILGLLMGTMSPSHSGEKFRLSVENVFYIKSIDRVIVTGSVSSGTVAAGDRLLARSNDTVIAVTVERLEHPRVKLESASRGQQVGLVLLGLRRDQVKAGDIVEAP